jgi:VCBS repeat-containing protein
MTHTTDDVNPDDGQTVENVPLIVQSKTFDPSTNPDVEVIRRANLRDSQKVRKEASYIRVTDRATGEYHHEALTIKTVKKLKTGEKVDEKRTLTLTTEDGVDEIQKLIDFLLAVRAGAVPQQTAKLLVVPTSSASDAERSAPPAAQVQMAHGMLRTLTIG